MRPRWPARPAAGRRWPTGMRADGGASLVNAVHSQTTAALLREGVDRLREAGSETPRLDAELLLGDAVGAGRTAILAHPEAPVGLDAARRFREHVERRATGEPGAYLRGLKE